MENLIKLVYQIGYNDGANEGNFDPPYNIIETKDVSDGNHTFEELYEHRCILFATLVNLNHQVSWKSRFHHDGTMYDDYFIVGIDTPAGTYSYHYHLENWELFECEEIERAPEWDGHQPKDVVRLLSLVKF